MKVLILDENGVAATVADAVENTEQGDLYTIGGNQFYVGFPHTHVKIESVPEGFIGGKYLYTDGSFVENPNYVPTPKPVEEELALLREQLDATQRALDELILGGGF
jgi:hypothetical protein